MTLYIDPTPNPSGAYPNPKLQPFDGCIQLNEEQSDLFLQYNGFVTVTTDPVTVVPNIEAWEAWKASLPPEPEPVPTLEERVSAVETGKAEQSDVDELNEALNMILTGVTE